MISASNAAQSVDHGGNSRDEVFAIVEDQQPRCGPRLVGDALQQIARTGAHTQLDGNRRHDEPRVVDRGEIDEAGRRREMSPEPRGRRQRKHPLADAARANDEGVFYVNELLIGPSPGPGQSPSY